MIPRPLSFDFYLELLSDFFKIFQKRETVFIVTEDERIPMPIGEYMMEDGSMLVVDEEGGIASINAGKCFTQLAHRLVL